MKDATKSQNRSIKKAFQVVETLADAGRAMRLQDLAEAVEMPPSTLLRFLSSLTDLGYISQDRATRTYRLTLRIAQLGERVRATFSHRDILRPYLEEARERIGESVSLSVMSGDAVVYVDSVEGPDHMLQTLQHIGKNAPLHSTGAGKVLLAAEDPVRVNRYLSERGLVRYTEHTITDPERFRTAIDDARVRGFARDDQECELGVRCIAVPIRDHSNRPVVALSVSAPTSRLDPENDPAVVAVLTDIAQRASRELGRRMDSE